MKKIVNLSTTLIQQKRGTKNYLKKYVYLKYQLICVEKYLENI